MNTENIAVGLDIGTTKIVAMIGRKNQYGKIEILGIGKSKSFGVKRGVVDNITKTTKSIQEAILDAEQKSGYKIKDVVVGIAGQHIRSMQSSDYISRPNPDEVIGDKDIEKLIAQVQNLTMLPGEEIIHVLPQEFKIDGQSEITEPIGMCGGRIESNFHIVVGQAASIRNVTRCIQNAGVDLSGLTLEPLASADSVLSEEEKEAGVALIDIGGGTTDLAIFKNGIIRHTAVIPFGGNAITDDIKETCSVLEKQAELLKVTYGSAWPGENKENELISVLGLEGRLPKEISMRNLSKIISARVIEIMNEVFEQIKVYGYLEPRKKLIGGIVLTGGGAELKHIKQIVTYVTGMDVRIGYPNQHLAGDTEKEISSPVYATVVGLLMNSLQNQSNSAEKISKKKEIIEIQKTVENNRPVENLVQETATVLQKSPEPESTEIKIRRSFFDKYIDKIKEFLDNAE